MPRPIAAGVLGIARTTPPPQISAIAAIVVPAMIETTSVDGVANGFNPGPASRNICGFSATTKAVTSPTSLAGGLRRRPFDASARMSPAGCGSITTTLLASRPCVSQPDSIAPPIFPAPARTTVPEICASALAAAADDDIGTCSLVVPANAGTHNHQRF